MTRFSFFILSILSVSCLLSVKSFGFDITPLRGVENLSIKVELSKKGDAEFIGFQRCDATMNTCKQLGRYQSYNLQKLKEFASKQRWSSRYVLVGGVAFAGTAFGLSTFYAVYLGLNYATSSLAQYAFIAAATGSAGSLYWVFTDPLRGYRLAGPLNENLLTDKNTSMLDISTFAKLLEETLNFFQP